MTQTISKTLVLGGRKVSLAPLSLRQLRELKPQIETCLGENGSNYLNAAAADALIDLVIASAKGSGETIDREYLLDNLNLANFVSTGVLLFERNGFLSKGDSPGEALAAPSPT